MRRILLISFVLYFLTLLFYSCDTRRYIYQRRWVTVEFSINWDELAKASKAGDATPNGATLAFYPTEGELDEPLFKLTNYTDGKVMLPVGRYNVLVFNETVNGHDYIQFTGTEHYDTFEAYWETTRVKSEYSRSGSDDMILDTDDLLLVDKLEGFEVSLEASDSQETLYLNFAPTLVTRPMRVLAHIKGMVNVSRVRSSLMYVEGMAAGYKLWSGEATQVKTTHLMPFNNKTYDEGSDRDGTMSASFYTFGDAASETKTDDDNIVRLSLALRDGTTHPDVKTNVSDQLNASLEVTEINVEIGTGLSDNDPLISLPDVKDTEGVGAGMDAEVGDWGEEIIIDLKL